MEQYSLRETLGVGNFSTVRKGYLKSDNSQTVAVKIISKKKMTENEREYINNELNILNTVLHPSIPKVIGIHETPEKVIIVMELIEGGELFDYLVGFHHLSIKESSKIICKLASIIKYLSELKIMHRDLKCENILISKDSKKRLKKIFLIDFGLSCFIDSRNEITQKLGTIGYWAPEVIQKEPYNESIDIWGIGVIYYLLLTGKLPFESKDDSKIISKTINSPLNFESEVFKDIDSRIVKFLENTLQKKNEW